MGRATHANAALTPRQRLRLARSIVEEGHSRSAAAEFFHLDYATARKWATRYIAEGPAGMNDRSSARRTQATRTPQPVVRKIVHLRIKQRLGPVGIAAKLGVPASTVHAVLVRCRINRLTHIDRVTGQPARQPSNRYERSRPGELIHVDVTKFGNIPDGGGWRYVGKTQGDHNRQATRDRTGITARKYHPRLGTCFVHTVIDDYSRIAYAECHDGETAATAIATAIAVLRRAVAWFEAHGVTIERVPVRQRLGVQVIAVAPDLHRARHHRQEDPPLPPPDQRQTERLHRTMADGWAYKKLYRSENARRAALAGWLHQYNHHRPHSSVGGQPPITRLDILAGHHS